MKFDSKKSLFFMIMSILFVSGCGISDGMGPTIAKKVFISATQTNGGFGGVTGGDTICETDANHPGEGTYKALIADGDDRSIAKDWVLKANTPYIRIDDNKVIGVTNSSATFDYPLDNSLGTGSETIWIGFDPSWSSDMNCSNWTDGTSGSNGRFGYENNLSLGASATQCGNAFGNIVCIEQ